MRIPGVGPKRVIDVVRLVDIMPTVLAALGFPAPATDGVSLLPLMNGQVEHLDLEAYSESMYPRRFGWSELRALRAGRFKFVSAPRPELYDVEKDPGEQRNLYGDRIDLAQTMAARLATLSGGPVASRDDVRPELDSETREQLAALGYVGPARSTADRSPAMALEDPKDCIGVYNAIVARQNPAAHAGLGALFNDASTERRGPFARASSCVSVPFAAQLVEWTSPAARPPARPTGRTLRAASR